MKKENVIAFTVRLPKPLKIKLDKDARDKKRSLNSQLIVLLEAYVNGRSEKAATA